MCLILFSVDPDDELHLVVAANRDEQHARPTARADYWPDHPALLAGRDLQAGGTWLGVTTDGRFAAVTNFAEAPPEPIPPKSRGDLTSNFLTSNIACDKYLTEINKRAHEYRGFNLIVSDGKQVFYYSNRDKRIRRLTKGHYGLSNQLLDCNWPKVNSARADLQATREKNYPIEDLFRVLGGRGTEEAHSARFILGPTYGTCASTVVKLHSKGFHFEERCYAPNGEQASGNAFVSD